MEQKAQKFISTLLISAGGGVQQKHSQALHPHSWEPYTLICIIIYISSYSILIISISIYSVFLNVLGRVSQQCFPSESWVWPQSTGTPGALRIFNDILYDILYDILWSRSVWSRRNPWGVAALRTPKLVVSNSAHTWEKKKRKEKKSCLTGFVVSAVLKGEANKAAAFQFQFTFYSDDIFQQIFLSLDVAQLQHFVFNKLFAAIRDEDFSQGGNLSLHPCQLWVSVSCAGVCPAGEVSHLFCGPGADEWVGTSELPHLSTPCRKCYLFCSQDVAASPWAPFCSGGGNNHQRMSNSPLSLPAPRCH